MCRLKAQYDGFKIVVLLCQQYYFNNGLWAKCNNPSGFKRFSLLLAGFPEYGCDYSHVMFINSFRFMAKISYFLCA